MTMLLFTRLQLISTWLIVQATTSLERQVTYTEHPTTTAHQVFTALQSDSTVSKALDASSKESVTARSPDVVSQVDQQWRYQPATLVLDTSSTTLATHNHIASLETFKVASENSSTGNQQQASLQSHKSSKEQRASLISQTSSSGHTSTTAPENSSHEEQIPTPSSTAGVQGTAVPSTLSTPQYGMTNVVQSLPLHPQNFSTEQSKTVESQLNPSPQNASLIAGEPLSSVDQVNLTQEQQNTTSYGQPWPTTSTPHQGFFNQIPSLLPQNTSIGQKISSLDQSVASLRHQNTISLAQNTSFGQPITLTSFRGSPSELQSSLSQNSYPSRILSPVVQLHSTLVQKNSTSLVQNSTQYGQPITVTPLKSSSANIPSLTLQNNSTTQPSSVADQVTSAQKLHNNTELQSSISKNSYPSRTLSPVVQLHSTLVQKNNTSLVQNSTQYGQPITVTPLKSSSANIPSLTLQNNSTTQPSSVADQVTSAQKLHNNTELQSSISKNSYPSRILSPVVQLHSTLVQKNSTSLVQNSTQYSQPITVTPIKSSSANIPSLTLQNNSTTQPSSVADQVTSAQKLHNNTELQSSISKNSYPSRTLSPVVQLHSTLVQKNNTSLVQNSTQYSQPITVTPIKGSSTNIPSLKLQNNSTAQPSSVVDQVTSAQELHNNASLTQSKYHEQSVNSYESAPAKVQTMVSSNSSSLQSLLSVEKLTLPIQKPNFTFLVQNGSNGQPTTVSSHTTSFAQLSSRKPQNSILEQTKTYQPYVNSTPKLLSLPSMFQNDSAEQLATTSTRPYSTIKLASLITKDNYTEQLLSITHQGNITYKQQPTSLIYSGKPTTDLFDVGSKVQNATLIPYSGNTEQISTSATQQNLSIKLSSLILQGNSAEQPSSPVNQTKSALRLLSQDSPFSLKPTSAESQANSFVQLTIFIPQNSSILTEIPPSALPLANLTVEQKFTTALQPTNLVSQKYSGEQLMTVSDSVQSNSLRTTLAHKHTVEQNSSIIHQDNSTILRLPNKNSSRLFATPVLVVNSTLQQKLTPTSALDDESTPKPSTFLPEINSSEHKFKTTKLSVHSSLQERNSTSFTVQTTATSSQFYSIQQSTQPSSVVDRVTSAQELHNYTSLAQSKYHEQSVTVKSFEGAPAKVQTMVSSNSSSLRSLLSVEKLTLPIQKPNFTFLVQNGSNGQPTTVSSHTTSFAQLSSRKPQNSILEQTKTYQPYVNSTPKLLSLPSMFQNDSAEQLATTSTRPYSTIKLASLITKDNYTEQLLSITHQGNITYKQQPTSLIYSGKPTTDLFDVGSKVQNATLIPYSGNTEQISTSATQQNLSIKLSSLILQGNSAEQPSSPVNQTKSALRLLSQDSPFSLKPTSAESQANSFVQLTIFIPQNSSILTEIPPSALPLANLTVEQKFTTALQPTNLVSQKYSGEQLMTVSDSVQSNSLRTTLAHKHTVEQNSSIIHQDNSTILRLPNKNSSRLFATPVLVVNSTLQQKLTPTSALDDESTPKPSTFLPEINSSEHKFKTTKLSVHSSLQERNSTSFTVQTTATSSQFYSTQQSTAITLPLLRKGKKLLEQRGRKTYRILSCCSNRL